MNIVFFLSLGTIISIIFGELGRFPFGGGNLSITFTDIFVFTTLFFCALWQIGLKKDYRSLKSLSLILPFYIISLLSLVVSRKFFGFLYLVRFIFYSMLFWVGYCAIKDNSARFFMMNKLVSITGVILSFIGFIQLLFFPDISAFSQFGFDPHSFRLVSTFLDPNFLGAFLCFSLGNSLILITNNSKKHHGISELFYAIFIVGAITFTFSRSSYLFLITAISYLSFFLNKKFLILLLSFLVILTFTPQFQKRIIGGFLVDSSSKERLYSWANGFSAFTSSPVIGIGFNNLRSFYQEKNLLKNYSSDGGHSGAGVDSSLLLVLATTGILGFFFYLFFWIKIFLLPIKNNTVKFISQALILGLFVNSQFINSLFFPFIMAPIFLFYGALKGLEE